MLKDKRKNQKGREDETDYESKGASSTPPAKIERKTLKEIMSKLVSISDVSGAAIVKADGSVISWHTDDGTEPTQYIDFISAAYQKSIHSYKDGMFTESITDYNGHKILMGRIRADVMLLLVLDKRAYLGLAMLDMEGCLREIDKGLDEHWPRVCETFD